MRASKHPALRSHKNKRLFDCDGKMFEFVLNRVKMRRTRSFYTDYVFYIPTFHTRINSINKFKHTDNHTITPIGIISIIGTSRDLTCSLQDLKNKTALFSVRFFHCYYDEFSKIFMCNYYYYYGAAVNIITYLSMVI